MKLQTILAAVLIASYLSDVEAANLQELEPLAKKAGLLTIKAMVVEVGEYCVDSFPELKNEYLTERQKWINRNAAHVDEANLAVEEIRTRLLNDPAIDKEQIDAFFQAIPVQREKEVKKFITFLSEKDGEEQLEVCRKFVNNINQMDADLRR